MDNTYNYNNGYENIDNTNDDYNLTIYNSFDDMELDDNVLRGIYSYGFEHPSIIQSKAIKPIIERNDIIAQSQSGTGKTGTFVISTLQILNNKPDGVRALILSPVREIAKGIATVGNGLGCYTKTKFILSIGGHDKNRALDEMRGHRCCVVGTPGRLIDMIEKGDFDVTLIELLIMDEADELLSSSFKEQTKAIVCSVPDNCQICLFSATMPSEALQLTKNFMNNPIKILLEQDNVTLEKIYQFYKDFDNEKDKFYELCHIYKTVMINQSIIFVNSKKRALELSKKLEEHNFVVAVICSDMTQMERDNIMKGFINGKSRILISTNLLSRGVDIVSISLVINYDLPNDKESYVHRIGRSGRYKKNGVAINFTTNYDNWKIGELERHYSTKIDPLPEPFDISHYLEK